MAHQGYYTNPSNLENVNEALDEVEAIKNDAVAASNEAQAAVAQVTIQATIAQNAANGALASENNAQTYSNAAEVAADAAGIARTDAASDALSASQSADNSQTYSIQAFDYRTEALGFRNEAEVFKNQAEAAVTGQVFGPASAVDNEIPRFDGSTGKLVKAGLKYQTSVTDTTSGALALVGAFGLGTVGIATSDLDAVTLPGFYKATSSATGTPISGILGHNVYYQGDSSFGTMVAVGYDSGRGFVRVRQAGSWGSWVEYFTTGNQLALGTTAASGRTALALGTVATQNYTTGTFTPVIAGTTTAGTGTYTSQVGSYTKIGDRVYFELNVSWTAHTGTGNIQLTGLPFSSTASTNAPVSILHNNLVVGTGKVLAGVVAIGTSNITFSAMDPAGTANVAIAMDTAASLNISGVYKN